MAEVKIFHDREGQTLTVWFTDPSLEHSAEETGDEVVLMKDRSGRVIWVEQAPNFSIPESRFCARCRRDSARLKIVEFAHETGLSDQRRPDGSATGKGRADVSFAFGASEPPRWRTRRARDGSVGKPL